MCRIGAIKSRNPVHVRMALRLMEPQQEGYDNSGFAVVLQDLGGMFAELKDKPLLSLACTENGGRMARDFMAERRFVEIAQWIPRLRRDPGLDVQTMPFYIDRHYDFPEEYRYRSARDREDLLMDTRLALRALLERDAQGFVYSFWPDVLTLKEIGAPRDIMACFGLLDESVPLLARSIVAQCRQNTNYAIARYAAHPFFLQGYTLCANGENTFFSRNRDMQRALGRGYIGFESDSQNLLYTLHYVLRELGWPVSAYKHVITPLGQEEMERRPASAILRLIRESLGGLEINGPNAIIACLPDGRLLACGDAKKLRPLVIGRSADMAAVTSEVCGLNALLPQRDLNDDIYPDERDTIVITPELEIQRWKQ